MKEVILKYREAINSEIAKLGKNIQDGFQKEIDAVLNAADGVEVKLSAELTGLINGVVAIGETIEKDAEAVKADVTNTINTLKRDGTETNVHVTGWLQKIANAAKHDLHLLVMHFSRWWANVGTYFVEYPAINEFWFTNDGQCFKEQIDAQNTAISLNRRTKNPADLQVTHVQRNNVPVDAMQPKAAPAPVQNPQVINVDELAKAPVVQVNDAGAPVANAVADGSAAPAAVAEGSGSAQPVVDSAGSTAGSEDVKMIDHTVTQADLDANPDLVADGVKVGDVIQIAVEDGKDEATEVKDAVTNKTAKKK